MKTKKKNLATETELAAEIARREGKKSQVRIGDIREIIRIMGDIQAETMMDVLPVKSMSPISAIMARSRKKIAQMIRKKTRGKK